MARVTQTMRGRFIESLSWPEVEALLPNYNTILLPLGARTKEHGPHLPLNNDWLIAEYLARRVAQQVAVLVLPTLQYSFYPAFMEYPGSVNIRHSASRDTIVDIGLSFQRHGIANMYVLNTGVSTNAPLADAQRQLELAGMTMRFADIAALYGDIRQPIETQAVGSHADEIETSIMLYLAPQVVRLEKAVKDIHPDRGPGGLTRNAESASGVYSPSGVYGDATLATREKGEIMVEGMVARLVQQLSLLPSGEAASSPTATYLR